MFISLSQVSCCNVSPVTPNSGSDSLVSPLGSSGRPKLLPNSSLCLESSASVSSHYPKAPGFEREDQVHGATHAHHVTGAFPIFLPFSFLSVSIRFNIISSVGRCSLHQAGRLCNRIDDILLEMLLMGQGTEEYILVVLLTRKA